MIWFRVVDMALSDINLFQRHVCVCVHGRRGPKVAVCMGESAALCLLQGVTRSCDIVSGGRRGTLRHPMCFRRNVRVCVCVRTTVVGLKLPCL